MNQKVFNALMSDLILNDPEIQGLIEGLMEKVMNKYQPLTERS